MLFCCAAKRRGEKLLGFSPSNIHYDDGREAHILAVNVDGAEDLVQIHFGSAQVVEYQNDSFLLAFVVKAVNDRLKRDVFQRIDSYKRGSDASLQRMEGCQNIVDRGEKTAVFQLFLFHALPPHPQASENRSRAWNERQITA